MFSIRKLKEKRLTAAEIFFLSHVNLAISQDIVHGDIIYCQNEVRIFKYIESINYFFVTNTIWSKLKSVYQYRDDEIMFLLKPLVIKYFGYNESVVIHPFFDIYDIH